jgi:pimeloyl-ACP methyl ester carboxylesterase
MDNWKPQPLDPGMIKLHRRGKGAPLVLIHCLGMSWRFWDVLEPLTDTYELIAYSLPGHHDTPLPGHQYGVPELTEQLHAVTQREGLSKFHLMGISLGGSIAQHYAGTYPETVDRLVLADCTPRYVEASRANWPVRAKAARDGGKVRV